MALQAPGPAEGSAANSSPESQQLRSRSSSSQPASALDWHALLSHSSSFEADDERSATRSADHSYSYGRPNDDHVSRRRSSNSSSSSDFFPGTSHPRRDDIMAGHDENGFGGDDGHDDSENASAASYFGEDTRPTSQREIMGWYMYAFASETYVICAIASFIPILLESLARENGVLLSDRTTPCGASSDRNGTTLQRGHADNQCVVYILGIEVNTASFAMYTFSVSVLLQALLVVSISCAADHGNYRKKLLVAFAAAGSLSVMLFLAVSARVYLLGAFLAVVSNTSFGASFVLLNSFLPLLVRHHPSVLFGRDAHGLADTSPAEVEVETDDDDILVAPGPDDSTAALLPSSASIGHPSASASSAPGSPLDRRRSEAEQTSLELTLATQISSKGIGIGYCAGLFVQCAAILVVLHMHSSILSQRVVLFGIGVWWGLFTIPAALWLRPRPGPPLPATTITTTTTSSAALAYFVYAWRSLFRTIGLARRLVDIVLFLAGWFLLSDAIATTSSTAILFAKTQLHMEVWKLGLISVISTAAGIAGAFSWAWVSRRLGLRPLHTILACLGLFALIPLYGLLGYLPVLRRAGVGGLQQPWEMFPLAAVYGLVLGGLSSYCRALYGELIPPGSEAAFYALYAITDKGSSIFGPAIVGAIIDASGEIRPAFWFLAVIVILPAPLFYCVDVDRGRRAGAHLAATIEGFRPGDSGHTHSREDDAASDSSGHTPRAILGDYDDDNDEPVR